MAVIEVNVDVVSKSLDTSIANAMTAAGRALGRLALDMETEAIDNASGPYVASGNHVPWERSGPNKRTGWLRKNIAAQKPVRIGFGTYTVNVTSGASYSRYVEQGTSRTGKYPFMQPALDTIGSKANEIFMTYYNKYRR
jgi:HK97 gp10 family phage protein